MALKQSAFKSFFTLEMIRMLINKVHLQTSKYATKKIQEQKNREYHEQIS